MYIYYILPIHPSLIRYLITCLSKLGIETDRIKSGSYRTNSQSFSRRIEWRYLTLLSRILAHFLWDIREYRIERSYVRKFETGYSTRSSRDGINRTEDGTKVDRERPEERVKNRRAGRHSYFSADTKCSDVRGGARALSDNESRSTFHAIKSTAWLWNIMVYAARSSARAEYQTLNDTWKHSTRSTMNFVSFPFSASISIL